MRTRNFHLDKKRDWRAQKFDVKNFLNIELNESMLKVKARKSRRIPVTPKNCVL
jgi:hypothetical protein